MVDPDHDATDACSAILLLREEGPHGEKRLAGLMSYMLCDMHRESKEQGEEKLAGLMPDGQDIGVTNPSPSRHYTI